MELKNGFRFLRLNEDAFSADMLLPGYDDSNWRTVRIPHDWGIEGDFDRENDISESIIIEDGMKKAKTQTGRTGALPFLGSGIYRKWINIEKADKVFLELDGVMWHSAVYINGHKAGANHFGYKSYCVDITGFVKFSEENLIAVYAEMRKDCSRWYPGGGIYRNMRLVTKPAKHIAYNGVWMRQTYADKNLALFDLSVDICSGSGFTATITDPNGNITAYRTESDALMVTIENPVLWDIEKPQLYTAQITLDSGDSQTVKFGPRICEFTKEGFFLNGRYLKLNGVCMHHDLGAIGAAISKSALRRQIEIMQKMGVNAWRTSHNPPAPELLDLCDEMGILVMDEFFDEWKVPKISNGYSKEFDDHVFEDIKDIVKRDRNHPCVIMWSVGNEVREQWNPEGWKAARMLYDAVRIADPTRPVTNGLSAYPQCYDNRLAFYTDIVGLNYKPHLYKGLLEQYPEKMLLGSETASCISTRGVYHLPAELVIGLNCTDDLAVSDYGLEAPPWAYFAEREFCAQVDNPQVMGEFVWTGFDYLGEPTPYYEEWPSRSSYFGIVDMAGLPKNRYYLYQSVWTNTPVLHIFPHWNWDGHEGQNVPVHIYTNFDEVELFINGVSQGRRTHAQPLENTDDEQALIRNQLERFRLMWDDTVYQPGKVTAVAYKNGKEVMRKTVKTAGAPHSIHLSAYREQITADGEDLNYITAEILDKDGNLCPKADNRIFFRTEGPAEVFATDAGDQRETETFLRTDKKALSGMVVAVIRATETGGNVKVIAEAEGLLPAEITFDCI